MSVEEPKVETLSKEAMTKSSLAIHPLIANAVTAKSFSAGTFGELDLITLTGELLDQSVAVNKNDLSGLEQMLFGQAVALNSMFNEFAHLAICAERISNMEVYMRLSLKAQAQSRATLQTLAEIKNPRPVAFVKQQNIANGHQQVNNGQSFAPAHAGKIESAKNELLEVNHGKRLDTRTQSAASGADQAMATVGEIDGAAHA